MLCTGIVADARYQDHDTGRNHPECGARIAALLASLSRYRRPGLKHLTPRPASHAELALIHEPAHIDAVARTAGCDSFAFDPDTRVSSLSYATACLATGGLLTLLDAIMDREIDNGFALVRPPGHHAERNRAMGFCLFNSVAIGAEYLRKRFGLRRVLIVDWDLHHGNGTQHSFYDDGGVLYVSAHQFPYYPGTGAADEVGRGVGEGYTVNLPIAAGWGDTAYARLFHTIIDPICRQFDPEFVLISAGFDAHERDPLGGLTVTETGFAAMARALLGVARDHAGGRCAAVLEGGYDLEALTACTARVLDEFAGGAEVNPASTLEGPEPLPEVLAIQRRYWELPAR